MEYSLLIPPFSGAIIGWVTNYVAIKLLFRPHIPVDVLGYKVQGVIPKRRKEIARSIARAIEKELLSSEDIADALKGIDWKKEIEKTVEEAVEHKFGYSGRLKGVPVIGLVSESLKDRIKYIVAKELIRHVDERKGTIAAKLKKNLDIKEMVVNKIDKLDLMRFESLLTEFIARELKHLEVLGGVMGFLIGLVQSIISYSFGI